MSSGESTNPGLEAIKKCLFRKAMRGEWNGVLDEYEKHSGIHDAKITKSGDTALHIAVRDGRDTIVQKLVEVMMKDATGVNGARTALKIKNDRGNTALHLAASQGSLPMCKSIAQGDSDLIGCRNNDGETPFFLAALHGKKDTFLYLHSIICENQEEGYSFCRRNDGETILHCAIFGDYFDLAYQIIHTYEKLVNWNNEQGFSPLHTLATKPSAFKSGSHLSRCHQIIYHCIFVDELEFVPPEFSDQSPPLSEELRYSENAKYPQNYETCSNFAWLLVKVFRLLVLGCGKSDSRQKKLPDPENPNRPQQQQHRPKDSEGHKDVVGAQGHHLFPENYITCFDAIKFLSKAMLIVFGLGSTEIVKIEEKKQKHVWSVQVLNKLLETTSSYEYDDNGRNPQRLPSFIDEETTVPYSFQDGGDVAFANFVPPQTPDHSNETSPNDSESRSNANGERGNSDMEKKETPILVAAKNGVAEMVDKILQKFPVAIHDMNSDKKNIVLLAVENRQPHVYQFLLKMSTMKEAIFRKVDKDGNSALHLAAKLGEHKPWLIPGSALQMQWEIKWYEFVKNSMSLHFFVRFNKEGKTPKDIFTDTHKDLIKSGSEWLTSTSQSCSVVAALIATVAFATSATVPGGVKQDIGTPTLENEPAFDVFGISSLIALCFSVTSVVMFLAILTSRYQENDFRTNLPGKLLLGLTSLFISIASMLISFCAGHFFVLKDKLKYAAFPVYAVTCLPVTFFAIAQFPLYFDLVRATFRSIPQRSFRVIP